MKASFFFYDLETSGFSPKEARIMQFAGQRTDQDLKPIGKPVNKFIKLSDDIIPDPFAILLTGITPQFVNKEGLTEAQFLKYFDSEISLPKTTFVGYNNIRFDDEFIRFLLYRNFYEPYEWQWLDGRSRWDLLDVVRMTRALRPLGLNWPFDSDGKPSNRLTLLSESNNLDHIKAHDALSDVQVTIALAELIKDAQPKLFSFLYEMRGKKKVEEFVSKGQPFVYTSGKYSSEFEKTTVVSTIAKHPKNHGVLVFDLRYDPAEFIKLSPEKLAEYWQWDPKIKERKLPIKTLQFNRCPAIAPLSVLDKSSEDRLKLDTKLINKHHKKLVEARDWVKNLYKAIEILDTGSQTKLLSSEVDVETELYDNFINSNDKDYLKKIQIAKPDELLSFINKLSDNRLIAMLPLYKAKNFRDQLSDEELNKWFEHRNKKLFDGDASSQYAKFLASVKRLETTKDLTKNDRGLLNDLIAYVDSLKPKDYDGIKQSIVSSI